SSCQAGIAGNGDGQLWSPRGVAVDGSGNLYVVDYDNERVQKFDAAGTFVTKWGSYGTGDGQFYEPLTTAVDGSGNVYVLDSQLGRFQKFTSAGTFLSAIDKFLLKYPWGIAVDGNGNVYATTNNDSPDNNHGRIQKLSCPP